MASRFQHITSKAAAGKAGKALLAILCVLLLTTQTVGVSHSHDNDSGQQADCEICLKLGSDDDVLIDATEPKIPATHTEALEIAQSTWVAQVSFSAHIRAPPLA